MSKQLSCAFIYIFEKVKLPFKGDFEWSTSSGTIKDCL